MKYFTLLLIGLLFFQCDSQPKENENQTNTAETETQQQAVAPVSSPQYPSITAEKMKFLWDNCDYVDFVFYETNFSMSQKEQNAIRTTLSGVATAVAEVLPSCKPVGRVFFQVDGQNKEEADLFFGGDCLYYIFFENGQYAYANQLTQSGFKFYKNIFEQVKTQNPQAG